MTRQSSPSADRIAALEAELARLRDSERMYRFSAELSARLVWAADKTGAVTRMEYPYVALTGMSGEEALGEGWLGIVHPEDVARARAQWRDSVRTGKAYSTPFRARIADGSYRMVRSRAAAIRADDGSIACWYGTTEDVEDELRAEGARREAEERLRQSEEMHRYTLEMSQQIAWTAAGDGSGLVLSDRYQELTGMTNEEEARLSIHPDDRERVTGTWEESVRSGTPFAVGCRLRMKDGSYRFMRVRAALQRDEKGRIERWYGVTEDVHEQVLAESEMRRMQAELIHVSRLSAMGTMASTLAHELNQPLTALSNFISGAKRIAQKPEAPREVLVEALEGAEAAALRAGEILRRLRDLVSRGAVAMVVDHLPQLIEEACVLAFIDAQALGIRHRLDLDPLAQWVRADRIQIQQVLINLVRNAVEAMEGCAKREVVIATRARDSGEIEISVADTGTGIAEGVNDSLFSQFMTTKTGGMGIGLPISRTIVEAHGGKIWAENRPEGGAVFRFTLPRVKRRGARPQL